MNSVKHLSVPRKGVILVLLGSYLPGYKAGGPLRSIQNMVAALGEEFHFRIVTLDRDLGDKVPFPDVAPNRWVRVGLADVMYLRPGLSGFLRTCTVLCAVDQNTGIYINSFFARRFSMLPVLMRWLKLCRPRCLVFAPRGEFSKGALNLKAMRKRLYIWISHRFRLHEGLIWHASSVFEATDIRRQFPMAESVAIASVIPGADLRKSEGRASQLAIASDLAALTLPERIERRPKVPGELRVGFVSRVARKKNLAGAIGMLAGLSGAVSFEIHGPAEDVRYLEECRRAISALPTNIRVTYHGQIEHANVNQVFADQDLFLFPTLGENYGHVICEALVSGCPLLISDQTPWRELEALGVGWDLPLSEPERFQQALQQCIDMGPQEHAAMCARAAAFGISRATNPTVIEENRALFRLAFQ